jgi:class 3 adenylate cyclase
MNASEIITEVKGILRAAWKTDDGRVVPDADRIKLSGNHGIKFDGTVLYADMSDSTKLVDNYQSAFAAEIYKCFLYASCQAIRSVSGEITAFDGDRVMAVFVGNLKNTNAAKAALRIHYLVDEINKAIKQQYADTAFVLRHCVGIDTSSLLVAKTGIRDSNDLVWVGRAANHAAKLAALNVPGYPTFITEQVYKKLNDSSKYAGSPREDMWEKRTWSEMGTVVYRSSWTWGF